MEDVIVRSRYPRRNVTGRRRKKGFKENSSIAESIFRQLILSILILAVAGIIKNVNRPETNFLSDKITTVVFQDMELHNIYEGIDGLFKKVTAMIRGESDPGTGQDNASSLEAEGTGEDDALAVSAVPYTPEDEGAGNIDYGGELEEAPLETEVENSESAGQGVAAVQEKVSRSGDTAGKDTAAPKYSMVVPVDGTLESPFGNRIHPTRKTQEFHKGLDIAANSGTPIKAVLDGEILLATYDSSYGNYVRIKHSDGLVTLYAHCSALTVKKGQKVKQGATIAKVGSTGDSIGPHLHFEVLEDGKAVNPSSFVKIRTK